MAFTDEPCGLGQAGSGRCQELYFLTGKEAASWGGASSACECCPVCPVPHAVGRVALFGVGSVNTVDPRKLLPWFCVFWVQHRVILLVLCPALNCRRITRMESP